MEAEEGTRKCPWKGNLAVSLVIQGQKGFLIGREQHEQRHGLVGFFLLEAGLFTWFDECYGTV